MGVHQSDLKIRSALMLGLEDIRKNDWLINYILEDVILDPYLKDQYQTQIESCKEWFKNNQIDVYMRHRNDKDQLPCITITLGSSQEQSDLKSMADASTDVETLLPNQIGKSIAYIVKPFTPTGYDVNTGIVGIDPDTKGIRNVSPGMILVNPENGEGMSILEIGPDSVTVEAGINLNATQLAIVPENQFYRARVEHTFFQESYNIGLHVHGDTQTLLWLHSIVMYSLLRYRESMLEGRGFSQTSISASDIVENPNYTGPGGEVAFSRFITVSGLTEQSWIKAPHRIIENVNLMETVKGDGCSPSDSFLGGIRIVSNSRPDLREEVDPWFPIDEFSDEEDD